LVVENLGHPTCRCDSLTADLKYIYWFNVDMSPEGLTDYERGTKCRKCGQTWWVIGMNQDAAGKGMRLF